MDLSTITVQDFKDLFFRDFPFLPIWDAAKTYSSGSVVFNDGVFYTSLNDGVTSEPPSADWEVNSDEEQHDYILDADITKAFGEAEQVFNQGLYTKDGYIERAYLYLTAHYLVMDIRASKAAFDTPSGVLSSRSVGSVSASYSVPEKWLKSDLLYPYTLSNYGIKYLSLTAPMLIGNVHGIVGTTRP